MKTIKNYLSLFGYTPMVLRFLWKEDHVYVLSVLFEALFMAVAPFPGIYLAKYTVDMISAQVSFHDYVLLVLILQVIILTFGILKSFFNAKLSRSRMFVISSKMSDHFYAKSMHCKYESLFDQTYQNKRELAMEFLQGGLSRLSWTMIGMLSAFLSAVFSICVLGSVDLLSIFIIMLTVFVESKLLLKKAKTNRENTDAIHRLNRKYSYYSNACFDNALFKDIKIFQLSAKLTDKINTAFADILHMTQKNMDYNKKYEVKYNAMEYCMTACVYLLVSANILFLHKPVGSFVIVLNLIQLFKGTLMNATSQFGDYYDNIKCMENYMEFMQMDDREDVRTLSTSFHSAGQQRGIALQSTGSVTDIEFRHVYFKYPDQNRYALKDVNVLIRQNDRIALIGLNGAGKTTFLKLLMRFYDVTSGQILINGIDVRTINMESYLEAITAVFQDFKIFSFTIKENVTALSLGKEEESRTDQAILKAGLEKKVAALLHGSHTYIQKIFDREGVELSGGEQQRLAFARALYKESGEVIVLDEPTASLDPIAEYHLYQKYKQAMTHNISFFVSHRLSCVNLCNQIMMFENETVSDYGSHEELLEKNQKYREMYEIQRKTYL